MVTCHLSPDGDAVAALLAFFALLATCQVGSSRRQPLPRSRSYRFLPGWEDGRVSTVRTIRGAKRSCGQGVRCSKRIDNLPGLQRPGPARIPVSEHTEKFAATPSINIDHHPQQQRLRPAGPGGSLSCLCLRVPGGAHGAGGPAHLREIATVLLVGIVADTLGFRTARRPRQPQGGRVPHGKEGRPSPGSASPSLTPLAPALKLWGRVLSRARVEGRLVWAGVTGRCWTSAGATMEDADNLVDFIAGVPGTSAAFLFSEQDGKIRVSMRTSQDLNAAEMAARLRRRGPSASCRLHPRWPHGRGGGAAAEGGATAAGHAGGQA